MQYLYNHLIKNCITWKIAGLRFIFSPEIIDKVSVSRKNGVAYARMLRLGDLRVSITVRDTDTLITAAPGTPATAFADNFESKLLFVLTDNNYFYVEQVLSLTGENIKTTFMI